MSKLSAQLFGKNVSVRLYNGIRNALDRRSSDPYSSVETVKLTLENALSLTEQEIRAAPNVGRVTISEFLAWKSERYSVSS